MYDKYHSLGLEIVSIAIDGDGEASWKSAIDQEEIGAWRHILYDGELVWFLDEYDFMDTKTAFILDGDKKVIKRASQDNLKDLKLFMDRLFTSS